VRRAVPAAVITLVGLAALASFRSSPAVAVKHTAGALIRPRSATPPTSAPPHTARTPGSPSTTPTTSGGIRTITGDPVDNRYGTVQVRVTLDGNTITGVTELQMPFEHNRSAEISQQAAPYLRQEILQAQSAQIDIVSGATYTSDSYAQSLQSALDRAHG
jgi:uncharacterized protein with FMN-binding domain